MRIPCDKPPSHQPLLTERQRSKHIGNDKSASRQMSTAPWHEPPTTLPGPSETLVEEICGGIAIAGLDRERRRVAGCFSGPGRPRTGEGLQQCPAPGLGETRWETDNAGSEGARTAGETASQRQEPSTVCGYPGGICSHRGPSGGPNEEERELTLAEDAAPKTSSIGLP